VRREREREKAVGASVRLFSKSEKLQHGHAKRQLRSLYNLWDKGTEAEVTGDERDMFD
jgi:hypothetical protein